MRVAYVIADYGTARLAQAARASILRHRPFAPVVIEADAEGRGYAAALNRGAGWFSIYPEIWCFCNSDVEMLARDDAVLELFDADPRLAIVGPRQVNAENLVVHGGIVPHEDGTEWDLDLRHRCWERSLAAADELTAGTFEVPMVPGSVFYVRAQARHELGIWHERFRFYYEDAAACYAARHRGWRVLYTGAVTWLHYGQRSPVKKRWRLLQMERARAEFVRFCAEEGIPLRDHPAEEAV
jgi:GT2 family glycosyltransferase